MSRKRAVPKAGASALLGLPLRVVLAACRTVVLVLLLLVLLDPVAALEYAAKQPGNVLVLVDCSESMGAVDPRTDDAEVRRFARALGKLPADTPEGAPLLSALKPSPKKPDNSSR